MTFYNFFKNFVGIFFKLIYRPEVVGINNIPKNEALVICSNHKCILDPIFLAVYVDRQIHFMAKKELFKNKMVNKFFSKLGAFPVDRDGADIFAIKQALRVLKNDEVLGIFPEGTRVKEINLDNAKSGVAMIAHKANALILPCQIIGDYKPFKKMKLEIKKPIDIRSLPKQTPDEYDEIAKNILSNIYGIGDENRDKVS